MSAMIRAAEERSWLGWERTWGFGTAGGIQTGKQERRGERYARRPSARPETGGRPFSVLQPRYLRAFAGRSNRGTEGDGGGSAQSVSPPGNAPSLTSRTRTERASLPPFLPVPMDVVATRGMSSGKIVQLLGHSGNNRREREEDASE